MMTANCNGAGSTATLRVHLLLRQVRAIFLSSF